MLRLLPVPFVGSCVAALAVAACAAGADVGGDARALLAAKCVRCHGPAKQKGGLRLDVRDGLLGRGDSGLPAVVVGRPGASELIRRVTDADPAVRMPLGAAPLPAAEVETLRKWVEGGAVWPDVSASAPPAGRTELQVTDDDRRHWAFRPLARVEPPRAAGPAPIRTPVDAFIGAALAARHLAPAPPADAHTLIRRLTFDLTGLPPAPEEVEAFSRARDPDAAYEALVDRLLASPRYGERWGRHWLDVARYADSSGYEEDFDRPAAYPYRDFVIRALNADLPFDRFVRLQVAGDEIEPDNPDAVAATGFLAAGPSALLTANLLEEERLRQRYIELDDMVTTTGAALLGLTLGCARCHDHKFDPLPARDYYRVLAALHSGDRAVVSLGPRAVPAALAFRDLGPKPATTWLFHRGDFHDHATPVALGFLTVLTNGKSAVDYWHEARAAGGRADTTYQRRALAAWVTDVDHGAGALLARVIVNRVWQHHFGEGLVRTPNDFGTRGERPTHPELLDWLAADLVAHGWRLKRLHRLIVLSATYRQATTTDPAYAAADPDNRLLGRMRPRRLEAEALRDALLAVSGTLNPTLYGPAVKAPIPAEAMVARNLKDPYPTNVADSPAVRRRSVYLFHKRVIPDPLLQAFDAPDAQQCSGRRNVTTVAPQALALLNDPFVRARAVDFADRLLREAGGDPAPAVDRAYHLAFGRWPVTAERAAGMAFLARQVHERSTRDPGPGAGEHRRQALADYCQVLFGLNEFAYVD